MECYTCSTQNTSLDRFHLSLQAILGQPSLNTLWFTTTLFGHPVSVLIDTSNSHKILKNRVVEFLHIVPTPTEPFKVMVGNIAYIEYAGFCPNIPLVVQIVTFQVPFYIFRWFFFRKVTETYESRNDTCFLSVMLRNLADYIIIPSFDLRNVTEPH